jgi:hypothetical protein
MPAIMNFAVARPKPPASAVTTGTTISATSGEAARERMSARSARTVRRPRSARLRT